MLADIILGARLALSEYPLIGRLFVLDTRRNRLVVSAPVYTEEKLVVELPPGVIDISGDDAFARVMRFVVDERIHYVSHGDLSHRVKSTSNFSIYKSRPICNVKTYCNTIFTAGIGIEYQYIDVQDLIDNRHCVNCWPKDFLEALYEWHVTRNS